MEANTNKLKNLVALLSDDIITVGVTYAVSDATQTQTQIYTYKCPPKLRDALKVGDMVVVQARDDSMSLAKVAEIHDECIIQPDSELDYKWIVGVLSTAAFKEARRYERDMLQAFEKEQRHVAREQLRERFAPIGSAAHVLLSNPCKTITETKISDMELSVRAINILTSVGIATFEEVEDMVAEEGYTAICKLPGMGRITFNEIKDELVKRGVETDTWYYKKTR